MDISIKPQTLNHKNLCVISNILPINTEKQSLSFEEKSNKKLITPIKRKKSSRCYQCKTEGVSKKMTLTNSLICSKCDIKVCMDHIGNHNCSHDHNRSNKVILERLNPKISFKKIDKI